MTWNDLTVQQFQHIIELQKGSREIDDPFLVAADLVEICFNLTRNQLDSLSTIEFKKLCKELDFLNEQPNWKPVPFVVVNGRRYRFVYDVRQIHAARNIEVKHFHDGGIIDNLHKMAASMVVPQRRHKWFRWRWVDAEYDAAKHKEYADDLRQAPITAIHGSAVFFCEVFKTSIAAMSDYLTSTMPTPETRIQLQQLLQSFTNSSDGSLMPQPLQDLSG